VIAKVIALKYNTQTMVDNVRVWHGWLEIANCAGGATGKAKWQVCLFVVSFVDFTETSAFSGSENLHLNYGSECDGEAQWT